MATFTNIEKIVFKALQTICWGVEHDKYDDTKFEIPVKIDSSLH